MEIARVKAGRLSRERLKKSAFRGRKECLMRKAEELSRRCGNPVCIILYKSKQSGQAETWPLDSAEVNYLINHYKNAITSRRKNAKNVNLTLSDLKLGRNKWAEAPQRPPVKKIWEKEFPHRFINELPCQKLAVINENIDATLRKIDDAMLQASAQLSQTRGGYWKVLAPCRVDTFEALMQQDEPIYWNQHGLGADQSADNDQFQMISAYHSNTVKSNIMRMCMSDQFGGQSESSNSNNTWHTSQNKDLASKEVSNQQLLLCANPFDHSGYGTLSSDDSVEFSSINSCENQHLFDWNSIFDQLQPQPAGEQMQMLSNAWDCYPQRTAMNGDGANSICYEFETGGDTFSSSIFDTLMNTEFM